MEREQLASTLTRAQNIEVHRRMIKTEEKANVVASIWGEECIQFFAALAILPRRILNNRINSSFSCKSSQCNSSYYCKSSYAKQLEQIFPPKQKRRPLPVLLSLSFFNSWARPNPLSILVLWAWLISACYNVDWSIPGLLNSSAPSASRIKTMLDSAVGFLFSN